MKASTRFEIKQAFVVDPKDIERLWEILGAVCPVSEVKITCSDGLSRICDQLEDVTKYDNPVRSAITSMEFICTTEDGSAIAEVVFSDGYSKTLSFFIRGEERTVTALRTELVDFFAGIKPWYSKLATFDSFWFWMPCVAVLLIMGFLHKGQAEQATLSGVQAFFAVLAMVIATALFIGLIHVLQKVAKFCFPITTYAIGQGSKRHALRENVRWSVIVSTVLGVLVSAIFAFL